MPWFSQGRDAADGRLHLGRRWWIVGPWTVRLDWDPGASMPLFEAISAIHGELAAATGGTTFEVPTWTLLKYLITPHPLGGCRMGSDASTSVVDHRGQVWGHPDLYVADGAIVPTAIGANPSRTIAALAERIASLIIGEGR
jgi:cholesterol oxidase